MKAKYSHPVPDFIRADREKLIDLLCRSKHADDAPARKSPRRVWEQIVDMLQDSLRDLLACADWKDWQILLSYPIPWSPEVVDAIILARNLIICLEFRLGAKMYERESIWELEEYCLKLREFHPGSAKRTIVPILVATDAPDTSTHHSKRDDYIEQTFLSNRQRLTQILGYVVESYGRPFETPLDPTAWEEIDFEPPPRLLEVVRALYADENVGDVTLPFAGAIDLSVTLKRVQEAVVAAKQQDRKLLCVVTGVPGSGKTFAAMNVAHYERHGVFLTPNNSLVRVAQQAIAWDLRQDENLRVTTSMRRAATFIQDLYRFFDRYFGASLVPEAKIVTYDDAQRTWQPRRFVKKYKRNRSEAEMLLEIMDRHQDWAVIVLFVGCGENISSSASGLQEWGHAIQTRFPHWQVLCSPYLAPGSGGQTIFKSVPPEIQFEVADKFHLELSARAYRAERLSEFVSAVLASEPEMAREIMERDLGRYPIVLTRSLDTAKEWLRKSRHGRSQVGLLASSGAKRIKSHGVQVNSTLDIENWLLRLEDDIRSSAYLEHAATEAQIHGLELDWSCVCWGADLRHDSAAWQYKKLHGNAWMNEDDPRNQILQLNKYHILLSRAREGMVIWVPPGDETDSTRLPNFYDGTFEYLKSCGIPEL